MKHIKVIIGTRPEAVKLAPLVLALKAEAWVKCSVCTTGQHRDMVTNALNAFNVIADADLGLMGHNQTLAGLTAKAITAIDNHLATDKPDLVVVQGDTSSVFCAALAALYQKVAVAHVEAGLRTGNLNAPWPEEANRLLTARLADIHFAPTATARENLLREGIPPERVTVTGNTVIDALHLAVRRVKDFVPEIPGLPGNRIESLGGSRIVLVTGHRRENFGHGIENICHSIRLLADQFPDVHFVYPVHLNPNIRGPVLHLLKPKSTSERRDNIHIIEPLPYLEFVALMNRSTLILTDSGGVQEEGPSLGKPVLVMRDVTERPEAVAAGTARLVGTSVRGITTGVASLLTDDIAYKAMSCSVNPYGDGNACKRIVEVLKRFRN